MNETLKNEKGVVLVIALMMIVILSLISMAAVQSSIFEIKLAGNQYLKTQAFQSSESGWQVTRTKLDTLDTAPTSPTWTVTETLNDPIRYKAVVTHVLNTDGTVKTMAGKPVYRIHSDGYQQESNQVTEVVVVLRPSLDPPAALYTHTDPLINSAKATVSGMDQCGSGSKKGIITTGNLVTVKNGTVEGFPESTETNSTLNINLPEMVDTLRIGADYSYTGGAMSNGNWGETTSSVPVMPKDPSLPPKVVYFDGNTHLTTSNGTGILLVKGDLELAGGFSWYGVVICTGSIRFTGNGGMNITGGVMSGSDATIDDTIMNGGVKIYYCSTVESYLKNRIAPTRLLSWQHIF